LGLIVTHIVLETVAGTWGVLGGIAVMAGAITVAFRGLQSRNRVAAEMLGDMPAARTA
jgi:hypothetical protein